MKTLGKMLCEARTAQQMTQETLANHLNVARTTVSNWERDEAQPDFYTLRRISELLHYDFFAVDYKNTANQEQKAKKLRLNLTENPLIEVISVENSGELSECEVDLRISGSDSHGKPVHFHLFAPFSVKLDED